MEGGTVVVGLEVVVVVERRRRTACLGAGGMLWKACSVGEDEEAGRRSGFISRRGNFAATKWKEREIGGKEGCGQKASGSVSDVCG